MTAVSEPLSQRDKVVVRRANDGDRWLMVGNLDGCDDVGRLLNETGVEYDLGQPALVMLLLSTTADHKAVIRSVRRRCPDSPLIGCTTAGLVDRSGQLEAKGQIVAIGGDDFEVTAMSAPYEVGGCRSAGETLASLRHDVEESNDMPHSTLLVLADGLRGDAAEVLRGIYRGVGSTVPIVGGCAADDLAMVKTYQFFDDQILSNAAVGALIRSTAPLGVGVAHGWTMIGEPMVVTASEGTQILALDDEPALDVYLRVVGRDESIVDGGSFARFAQTRPLAIKLPTSEVVRFITGADMERRRIDFLVHIPEGQLVWFMEGDRDSVIRAAGQASKSALEELGDREPLGLIAFDCVARRSVLGDSGLGDELAELMALLPGDVPIGGFYTYGEIARSGGALGFHNQTMVALAMA